jgi:hypothetical protein
MISLSAHGLRGSPELSRRGFLIAKAGAGVMLGYTRSGPAIYDRSARAGPVGLSRALWTRSLTTPASIR